MEKGNHNPFTISIILEQDYTYGWNEYKNVREWFNSLTDSDYSYVEVQMAIINHVTGTKHLEIEHNTIPSQMLSDTVSLF